MVLENDREVLKWFKPAKGSFQIHYASDASYEPDFVIETRTAKFLCEPKAATDLAGEEVQAKARAAAEWCRLATTHERKHGGLPAEQGGDAAQPGKPWSYLLIPHDVISDNKTLQGLTATYTYRDEARPKAPAGGMNR